MINEENSGSPAKSHSSENEVGSDTEPVSAKKKRSSGSADVEDNGSVASATSLQNEEEIKEQQQYQILKQSLRALQERASNTILKKGDDKDKGEGEQYSGSGSDSKPYPSGLVSDDSDNQERNQHNESHIDSELAGNILYDGDPEQSYL